MEEIRFMEALDVYLEAGLSFQRMGELLCDAWRSRQPEEARVLGPRASAGEPVDAPEAVVTAEIGPDFEPMVKLSMGDRAYTTNLFRARGIAAEILMQAEAAETEVCLRQFFSRANDQPLAQRIVAALLPELAEYRLKNLSSWATQMLSQMASDLAGPQADTEAGA